MTASPERKKIDQREEACRESALRLLNQRAHSRRELVQKLTKKKFALDLIDSVLDDFQRTGLIDDESYAKAFVQEKVFSAQAYGSRRIKCDLQKRGIAACVAEAAIGRVIDEEPSCMLNGARRAAEYKLRLLRSETDGRKKREKLFRFLTQRGFSPDVISQVVGELGLDQDEVAW